jgi:DNA end-binding protein Ku
MYFADEVREPAELAPPKAELRKAEVEMARSLVENLTAEFDPAKYDDQYRRELMELIRAKAEGQELPEPAQPEAEVVDLMQALRESVERTKRRRARTAS